MAFHDKYKEYFNIDPEYFPAINEAEINARPDLWKKFYPHPTFIKLLKDTVDTITLKNRQCLWVEGEYGTGKSHATLTLKKLLESTEQETKDYFEKFDLDKDFFNMFQATKNNGDILVIHRYGSSSIKNDYNLVFAIQESIENTLKEKGISNICNNSLKESIISWLSDEHNKAYFNSLVTTQYENLFSGDDVDDIIDNLNRFSGEASIELTEKIFKVANERNIKAMNLDVTGLCNWIKELIAVNNFKSIFFIWDEFTEYFSNNMRNLTGFQEIVEVSMTHPFYLMIVTHKSEGLFYDTDKDNKKILDRFKKPTCKIELPENIAFELMGFAMEKKSTPELQEDWGKIVNELYSFTHESRNIIKNRIEIKDDILKSILPIHPYTIIVLKNISSIFDSNQRSMFDFIKNDNGDEIKGFQWYINNFGPADDNKLLTIDMLWDFFYERGKEHLSREVRTILDCYNQNQHKKLNSEEKRVFKAILLLQAILLQVNDTSDFFIPNKKSLDLIFEGSDLESGRANNCAKKLVKDEILYEKPLRNGNFQYSVLINVGNIEEVKKFKEQAKGYSTEKLIIDGNLSESILLTGALNLRYELVFVSENNFNSKIKSLRNQEKKYSNKILTIVAFAKNDEESLSIHSKIQSAMEDDSYNMIFIDATSITLGRDAYEQYCDHMAQSLYHNGKDGDLSKQHNNNALELLTKWKNRITNGEFIVYTNKQKKGEKTTSIKLLINKLAEINKNIFKYCLEGEYNVTDQMYTKSNLKLGVECGINQEVKQAYRSNNDSTKLENALGEAWKYDGEYWNKNEFLLISKIKISVDNLINQKFDEEGRISIADIYELLKGDDFGFMPCNLTAFVMGFILKEYVSSKYTWSDDFTSEDMTVARMKDMINDIILLEIAPNSRYRNKYIVALTEDEKSFFNLTKIVFGMNENLTLSIPDAKTRIRTILEKLSFPIWTLKHILANYDLKTNISILEDVIDKYCGIVNSNNYQANKFNDIEIAHSIGKIYMENPFIGDDLNILINKETCIYGMKEYLKIFQNGELIKLANEIGDKGQYINVLGKKFISDASNWVWNLETAESQIKEVILDYKIILESNNIIDKSYSIDDAISGWCEKCNYIKVSYSVVKNYVGDLDEFLELLYNINKSETILSTQKEIFYNLIVKYGNQFKEFYNNQFDIFKKSCSFYIENFSNEEAEELFSDIDIYSFIKGKSEYNKLVDEKSKVYKNNSKINILKSLWKEKTNTETPSDWSIKYKMPILCMISDDDLEIAKSAFNIINKKSNDMINIDNAITFINNDDFIQDIKDDDKRDSAFIKYFLKDSLSILLTLEESKQDLIEYTSIEPYEWFGSPTIEKRLLRLADAKYDQHGCDTALEKINNMDATEVKNLLKELIRNNISVGVAILKERKF